MEFENQDTLNTGHTPWWFFEDLQRGAIVQNFVDELWGGRMNFQWESNDGWWKKALTFLVLSAQTINEFEQIECLDFSDLNVFYRAIRNAKAKNAKL